MRDGCVFCDYEGPSRVLDERVPSDPDRATFVIEPLYPVVSGHVMVISRRHVESAMDEPSLAGAVFEHAAERARASVAAGCDGVNIITNIGKAATQSVRHLHVHVVPRFHNDGLCLPWSCRFGWTGYLGSVG